MRFEDNNEELACQHYKIKGLKVFGSKENLFHNFKKYRKVYDEAESRYVYCELSFYNKLFDNKEWEAKVKFVCTNLKTEKQVCELVKTVKIGKEKNIVYVREGWGTPDPGWWKAGSYQWEVFFNDFSVGKTEFYVVNGGVVSPEFNPYFSIKSIHLFESAREGQSIDQRKYLKTFSSETTKYLNVEMTLESHMNITEDYFPLELQFNFYNDAGQHKAYMSYFKKVKKHNGEFILDTGYGSDNGGYWYDDKYTLEIIFMDQLIAIVPFEVAQEEELQLGDHHYSVFKDAASPSRHVSRNTNLSFNETKKELDELIGLRTVKSQINELATYLQFIKIRQEKGLEKDQEINLHSIFTGNPGTGKTTVANMLGKIYHSLGLLSHGKVHEVGRADLVGEFIGQTAPKVKKVIEKARGGILFIDEAYALTNRGEDGKDFGREVVEVLLKELSDGEGDLAIICAGYPKEMQHFLDSNPGMNSRIRNIIKFPDYTPDELIEIAEFTASKRGVILHKNAKKQILKNLVEIYRNRNEQFGNARYINGLVEEAKQNMALRLMNQKDSSVSDLDSDDISTIRVEDVNKVFKQNGDKRVHFPIDEELLQSALAQLHDLVGLSEIKREVDEMVKLARYYKEIGRNISKTISLHTIFKGNPGTGKTTVARLLVQIYKALGILERGHLIECDRKSLVAGFVGQTAIKTGELIEKSMGGGLFIDEAYALSKDGDNDFGKEAIETLLKEMEDKRGEFMVIVAGYPKEMGQFIQTNPGLMSRFDKSFDFKDYSDEELLLITKMLFDQEELKMDEKAENHIKDYIEKLLENKHKYFGNARTIRKIVQEAIKRQNLRMADIPPNDRTWLLIHTVELQDVEEFKLIESDMDQPRNIGFRMR